MCRLRRQLEQRCGGNPGEDEKYYIKRIVETAWQKHQALKFAQQARAIGDAKRDLEERKLADRAETALILHDRALTAATRLRRAEEKAKPPPSFEELLASIAQRRAAET